MKKVFFVILSPFGERRCANAETDTPTTRQTDIFFIQPNEGGSQPADPRGGRGGNNQRAWRRIILAKGQNMNRIREPECSNGSFGAISRQASLSSGPSGWAHLG